VLFGTECAGIIGNYSLGQVPHGFLKRHDPYGFLKRHDPTLDPLAQSAVGKLPDHLIVEKSIYVIDMEDVQIGQYASMKIKILNNILKFPVQ
jgi:hypothetical protein